MPKFKLPPPVPGVGDLPNLLVFLEHAKRRDKWISDAKKVLEDNQKAVRLLGAEEEIQKNLDRAQKEKDSAIRAMDNARAASQSITEDAEKKFTKREADLKAAEQAHVERMAKENSALSAKIADFEAAESRSKVKLKTAQDALEARLKDVSLRESAISAREKRAETNLEKAKAMKAEATQAIERVRAAMPAA